MNVSGLYRDLLAARSVSPRGDGTREMLAVTLQFDYGYEFITHYLMPDNSAYVQKELSWYVNADVNDLSIADHASIWKNHIVDGKILSNYGYQLWGKDRGSMANIIKILREDRDSRRAVAFIGDREYVKPDTKDVPCTNLIQFLIREKHLTTIVSMRSQDAWFGLRNDLPAFWFFSHVVASIMDVASARLIIQVGSFHLYERNVPAVSKMLEDQVPARLVSLDRKIPFSSLTALLGEAVKKVEAQL